MSYERLLFSSSNKYLNIVEVNSVVDTTRQVECDGVHTSLVRSHGLNARVEFCPLSGELRITYASPVHIGTRSLVSLSIRSCAWLERNTSPP